MKYIISSQYYKNDPSYFGKIIYILQILKGHVNFWPQLYMQVHGIWTNLLNMSERISKASSWIGTSSCIPNAPINWDVIFLQTMTVRLETVRPCWSRECSPSSPPDTPSLYPPEDQDYTNQKYTLKKCWAKYNPALGKIWTNPAIGLFSTNNFDNWVKKPKQSLGLSIFHTVVVKYSKCIDFL